MKHKQLKTSAKSTQKKKKFFVSVEHRAIPQFLISYWLCPLVWSTEIEKGRENEKVGGKQAKLNRRGSGRELEKGDKTGKGGAILLPSNGRESKKEAQKEGAVLLMSNGRERDRKKRRTEAQFHWRATGERARKKQRKEAKFHWRATG